MAVGYDEKGNELARATQVLNVPHPPAEVTILLSEGNRRAEIHWLEKAHEKPSEVLLTVDDVPVALDDTLGADLPPLDPAKPHVIEAEIHFPSGAVARHDVTLAGGTYSDSVESELTPIVLKGAAQAEKLSACFGARVAAVEKSFAVVVVVKDPNPMPVLRNFALDYRAIPRWPDSDIVREVARLDANTAESIVWPVMQLKTREGSPTMDIYDSNGAIDAHYFGMLWTLTRAYRSLPDNAPRRYADAVAVAGMMAAEPGTRRAVVLLLQPGHKDESARDAATVRDYLKSMGVPLFVWSIGATKEQRQAWVDVTDVSNPGRLGGAAKRLREELASQTVAWVATDAWHALRAAANPCH